MTLFVACLCVGVWVFVKLAFGSCCDCLVWGLLCAGVLCFLVFLFWFDVLCYSCLGFLWFWDVTFKGCFVLILVCFGVLLLCLALWFATLRACFAFGGFLV